MPGGLHWLDNWHRRHYFYQKPDALRYNARLLNLFWGAPVSGDNIESESEYFHNQAVRGLRWILDITA